MSLSKTAFSAADISSFCQFCTGRTTSYPFLAKCRSLCNTTFPSRDQHVLSFLQWLTNFERFLGKCMRLYKVQHSVFILRSPRFVILTLDVPRFRQKCTSLYKTVFWSGHQHALTFSLWANYFLAVFSKVHEFVKNIVFSPQWARFVIFALGVPLFSEFQQSARLCTKQRFRRDVSTFCHFRTGHNTFYLFWAKCASFYKTAFSDRDQHVLSLLHWVHHFLAIFSKVHEFVQNSVFNPRDQQVFSFSHCAHQF